MSEETVVYVNEEIEDLIPDFLENRREDIRLIDELLEKGEMAEIHRIGHSMKGSGGGYGFDEISKIGKELEEAAKMADQNKIRELKDYLSSYLSTVKVVFQEQDYK